MDNKKFTHFGLLLNDRNDNRINRESYAIINKKVTNKLLEFNKSYYQENPDARQKKYDNVECTNYSDSWCLKHQEECLKNYDYNMKYFELLDDEKFNKKLNKFIKKYKLKEIKDLNLCKNISGVYLMVLDNYKQVYIGISKTSICDRIKRHWYAKKEFDKLIFGKVDNSIISIDSFGPLDTTRIYVYPTCDLYEMEEKMVNKMDSKYLLNRTAGGIGSAHNYTDNKPMALLSVISNIKTRKLNKK